MPRFIALLRGVNVGKGRRVPMADFRTLLEALGHTQVGTLLNSGNAVFNSTGRSTARHAAAIGTALQQRLGVVTPVIVKSSSEWAAIVAASPVDLPAAEHPRYLAVFAPDAATLAALEPLQALAQAPERLVITPVAAYLHCPGGLLQSRVGEALLGKTGVTTRNWATVLKLAALAGTATA